MVQRQLGLNTPPELQMDVIKLTPRERADAIKELMEFAQARGLIARYDPDTRVIIVGVDYASRPRA